MWEGEESKVEGLANVAEFGMMVEGVMMGFTGPAMMTAGSAVFAILGFCFSSSFFRNACMFGSGTGHSISGVGLGAFTGRI